MRNLATSVAIPVSKAREISKSQLLLLQEVIFKC
jgi:hypothetical protein